MCRSKWNPTLPLFKNISEMKSLSYIHRRPIVKMAKKPAVKTIWILKQKFNETKLLKSISWAIGSSVRSGIKLNKLPRISLRAAWVVTRDLKWSQQIFIANSLSLLEGTLGNSTTKWIWTVKWSSSVCNIGTRFWQKKNMDGVLFERVHSVL